MRRVTVALFAPVLAVALACGGGSGSGPAPAADQPPTAVAQSVTTPQDTGLPIVLTGSDPEGRSLTFAIVDPPSHGALAGAIPALTYTPAAGYHGPDAFAFTVSDGAHVSAKATVTIAVTAAPTPSNRSPIAGADAAATDRGWPVEIDLLANDSDPDGDPLSVLSVAQPAHGTAALQTGGRIRYRPSPSVPSGGVDDTFTYTLGDGAGGTSTGSVTVRIRGQGAFTVSPATLDFAAGQDGPAPASQTLTVTASGESAVHFSVRSSAPWLEVTPGAGAARAGSAALTVKTSALVSGGWIGTTTESGAPEGRYGHTATWTGAALLVWGGRSEATQAYLGDGAAYDPAADAWSSAISTEGAPAPRNGHSAVWTGREVLVWGGQGADGERSDGAAYDPRLDLWRPISTAGAPGARETHTAVWTGTEMVVWGGFDGATELADGARYDPLTDTWAPLDATGAPSPRARHVAVFTGTEMVVWGGLRGQLRLADGGRWTPGSGWSALPADPALPAVAGRDLASAVWTGREMLVWGGELGIDRSGLPVIATSGARWRPGEGWIGGTSEAFGAFRPARLAHAADFDGEAMIVWGGYGGAATGGRYRPPCALLPGTYAAAVTISDPAAATPARSVPVSLTVTPEARLAWAVDAARAGAGGNVSGAAAVAPGGDAWLVGAFSTTVDVAPDQASLVSFTAAGWGDAFLARFDGASGALLSARRIAESSGATSVVPQAIAVAPDGSIRVSGSVWGAAVFDRGAPGETSVSGRGFVARFAADGSLTWVRPLGPWGGAPRTSLAVGSDGSTYVAGTFDTQLVLGAGEPNETTLTSAGFDDGFLARYGPDGALAWAVAIAAGPGLLGGDPRVAIAVGPGDAITVTGTLNGTGVFGAGPSAVTLDGGNAYAMFVARYGPDGALAWARQSSGGTAAMGRAVAATSDGGAWVTGSVCCGPTELGHGEAGATTLSSPFLSVVFVARFRSDGTLAAARAATAWPVTVTTSQSTTIRGASEGAAISALSDGGALVAGSFEMRPTLWPGEPVSAGGTDLLVMRVAEDGAIAWARSGGGTGDEYPLSLTAAPGGGALVLGGFYGTATFGAGEPRETTLTPGPRGDLVLLKTGP